MRGAIVDRNNDKLAFTIEARALTFQPVKVRKQLEEAKAKTPEAPDPQRRLRDIAAEVALRLNNKPDATTVLKKLTQQRHVRLPGPRGRPGHRRRHHHQVPRSRLPSARICASTRADRWPPTSSAESTGTATAFSDWRIRWTPSLAGTDGSVTYDRGSDGVVIPGSYRNRHDAVDGSTVMLTLDDDIQFYVQQQVQQAKDLSGAKNVSAVVLDAKTGEVLAMSNDNTFDPSQDIGRQEDRRTGQPVGVVAVRAGLGEQDHHRRLGDRVRAVQPRRGAAGPGLRSTWAASPSATPGSTA